MRGSVVFAVIAASACSANDDMPAPQISSVSPNHGPAGNVVLVSGSYFCHQPATEDPLSCSNIGSIEFGTSVAVASQYTDNSIMVDVPNGTGSVQIVVEVRA
jgi:hypothetical protein